MLEFTLKINTIGVVEFIKKAPHNSSVFQLSFIVGSFFMTPPHHLRFFLDGELMDTSPEARIKLIDFFTDEDYRKGKVIKIQNIYSNINKTTLTICSNRNELYLEDAQSAKLLALCALENPNFSKLPFELLHEIFRLISIGVDRVNSNSLFSNCLTLRIRNQEEKIKKERESIPIAASGFFKSTPLVISSDEAQEFGSRDLTTSLT